MGFSGFVFHELGGVKGNSLARCSIGTVSVEVILGTSAVIV